MRTEQKIYKMMIKIGLILLTALTAAFYSNDASVAEITSHIVIINIILSLLVFLYGFVSFILNLVNSTPVVYIATLFFSTVATGIRTILGIYWYQEDQTLVIWLNLLWEILELCYSANIAILIYIINNFQIIYLKYLNRQNEIDNFIERKR